MVKCGNIHSGIPTPEGTKVLYITLGNKYYEIKKKITDYFSISLRTETISMNKKTHRHIYNKKINNHLLHLLALNKLGFQLKLIIVLYLIQNPQPTPDHWNNMGSAGKKICKENNIFLTREPNASLLSGNVKNQCMALKRVAKINEFFLFFLLV